MSQYYGRQRTPVWIPKTCGTQNLRYPKLAVLPRGASTQVMSSRTHTLGCTSAPRDPPPRRPSRSEHSPLHNAHACTHFVSLSAQQLRRRREHRGRRMSCGERVAGDSRGLVGAMTLTSTQTGLVLTIRTSAATSLSAPQQDRGCTSPTSFSEVDRSHPAPHDLVVKLKPHELVVKLKTSCLLLTSASAIDTSEVGSSASRCSISILAPPPRTFFDSPTPPCRVRWASATSYHAFLTPRTPTPPRAAPRRCVRARFQRHPPSRCPYWAARDVRGAARPPSLYDDSISLPPYPVLARSRLDSTAMHWNSCRC